MAADCPWNMRRFTAGPNHVITCLVSFGRARHRRCNLHPPANTVRKHALDQNMRKARWLPHATYLPICWNFDPHGFSPSLQPSAQLNPWTPASKVPKGEAREAQPGGEGPCEDLSKRPIHHRQHRLTISPHQTVASLNWHQQFIMVNWLTIG